MARRSGRKEATYTGKVRDSRLPRYFRYFGDYYGQDFGDSGYVWTQSCSEAQEAKREQYLRIVEGRRK